MPVRVIYCITLVVGIAVLTVVLLALVKVSLQSGPADEGWTVHVWLEKVWVLVPPLIVVLLLAASWHRMTDSRLAC